MKHIINMFFEFITMVVTYLAAILSLLFDGIVFGIFVMLINNYSLARLYSLPEITYVDAVGIVFLIKLVALMVKSINIGGDNNNT